MCDACCFVTSEDDGREIKRKVSVVEDDTLPRLTIRRKASPPPSRKVVPERASNHEPPPSRNPVTSVLSIINLVRPFTVVQLKELLERTGTIAENGFWTNKIKSVCLVKVSFFPGK